jgi:hypothetical protein
MGLSAIRAAAAEGEAEYDVISDLDVGNIRSDGLDDPGALMSKHNRHRNRKRASADHVGVADADAGDSNQNFILARRLQDDVLDCKEPIGFRQDSGSASYTFDACGGRVE